MIMLPQESTTPHWPSFLNLNLFVDRGSMYSYSHENICSSLVFIIPYLLFFDTGANPYIKSPEKSKHSGITIHLSSLKPTIW